MVYSIPPFMNLESAWKLLQLLAWGLAVLVFYFNDASALRERMAINETKVEQELRGYTIMQADFSRRLERLEAKVDRVLEVYR